MLITIRVVRVMAGLIAIWQIIGLLPVLTTWLPNLQLVTEDMWVFAILKLLILIFFGWIYFWLGRIKDRIGGAEKGASDSRILIFIISGLVAVGIVLAIAIPTLTDREKEAEAATEEPFAENQQAVPPPSITDPWIQNQGQDSLLDQAPAESQAATAGNVAQQPGPQPATLDSSPTPETDRRFQRRSVGVDYTDPSNTECWNKHQAELARVPADAPLGEYARLNEIAQRRLDRCVAPK